MNFEIINYTAIVNIRQVDNLFYGFFEGKPSIGVVLLAVSLNVFDSLSFICIREVIQYHKDPTYLMQLMAAYMEVTVRYGLAHNVPYTDRSIVFRVKRHPQLADFEQCVSFGAFSTEHQEVFYNVFCLCAMYFFPLVVITVCYVCIFCEIHKSSKDLDERKVARNSGAPVRLRRSDRRMLERARRRTLRMTVTIVTAFALCWLPYATITMWYMIDRQSASRLSPSVQDMLFVMAVSNSCMNPLVYGSFTLDIRGAIRKLIKACCKSSTASDTIGNTGSSSSKNRNMEKSLVRTLKDGRVRPRLGVRFAETSFTAVPERLEVPKRARGPA